MRPHKLDVEEECIMCACACVGRLFIRKTRFAMVIMVCLLNGGAISICIYASELSDECRSEMLREFKRGHYGFPESFFSVDFIARFKRPQGHRGTHTCK